MSLDPSDDPGVTPDELEPVERRTGEPDRRRSTRERFWLWFGFGHGRGYRDIWLLVITFFVWQSFGTLKDNRIDATRVACTKSNEQTAALNGLATALQVLVLSGAALPGDRPSPSTSTDPSKWTTLKPGPLSMQLERQYPDLPTAQERLERAKANAGTLESKKVTPRNCQYDVDLIRGDATPTPAPKRP
jgi:hypothetical protein